MAEITLKLAFDLRDWQREVVETRAMYIVLVCHRRSWKTVLALLKLLIAAFDKEGHYWYVAPFYKQAKNIAWDILKKLVKNIPDTKINGSELKVILPNGSKMQLFWADNIDSLRWMDFKWVVYDEVDQQPSTIHSEIISPMLIANNWFAIWLWTPKGRGQLYKAMNKYKDDKEWFTLTLKASESWLLTKDQLNKAKAESDTEDIYEQEYECSIEAAIQWAY